MDDFGGGGNKEDYEICQKSQANQEETMTTECIEIKSTGQKSVTKPKADSFENTNKMDKNWEKM